MKMRQRMLKIMIWRLFTSRNTRRQICLFNFRLKGYNKA
ncbi:hypothetical protein TREAZ_1184 [Leadbettera azotonutricia ZAS-9]|uniref:Uncharacterized protein n=1 Tax=Leadbettera azotonutricia (strain ATCC BAA-888 / DSM 13862 / ZAS-9) TaxID=545695 RepID=F5Y713_LEAAZ|nr:hypothetical protein TREAZ_1184 [Leadbettera azotonutricia ZAS-9]